MKSSYYKLLEAFYIAIVNLINHPEPESPTKPEKMLFSTLKKYWPQMTKHVRGPDHFYNICAHYRHSCGKSQKTRWTLEIHTSRNA